MSFSASFRSSVRECISSSVLRAIIQAGFANNFKDGVAWGLLPAFFGATGIASSVSRNGSSPVINSHAVPASQLGALLTAYPLIWGLGQLFTGRASDRWGRGRFVFGGLLLQSLSLVGLVLVPVLLNRLAPMLLATPNDDVGVNDDVLSSVRFVLWMLSLSLLGVGTAMSYPVLQAYIGDVVAPARRASALGLYRLCRDLGYAFGGVGAGLAADRLGVDATFLLVGALLALSSFYAWICLPPDQQPPARRVASPSLPANVAHHKEDARQA
jgi:MFS family permease